MSFFKITYNARHRFATLHSYGCTYRCGVCSYKLRSGENGRPGFAHPRPTSFLSVERMKTALRTVSIDTLYFMGGEPTVSKELQEMIDFGKLELRVRTYLGHTNGSKLPLPNLDGANVGLKAWHPEVHRAYTGRPKQPIFDNFARAVAAGMDMKANVVFIPGYVDLDQVEAIAAWIGALRRDIPFHIMGYIPVPGQPFARPTESEMEAALAVCRRHLDRVGMSHLTPEQAMRLAGRDDRFAVQQIA